VALIGGGRWARVHASVLQSLHPRVGRILWISRHYRHELERDFVASTEPAIEMVDSFDQALRHRPDAAVVCTASTSHAPDASLVLEHGVPVLVEKPMALDVPSAVALIALAEGRGLPLYLCLPLLMAWYLRQFKMLFHGRTVVSMRLHWFDPAHESRYGDVKQTDVATHKVDEIIPHLWSLIDLLIGPGEARVVSAAAGGADTVSLTLAHGHARVEASFGRRAAARIRRIELSFADEGHAELDFAREPGQATIDGKPCSYDGSWESHPRPLSAVYTSFLDRLGDAKDAVESPILARRCIGSVRLAQELRGRVVADEARRAAALLRAGQRVDENPELLHLIVDNLGPELARRGQRIANADQKAHRLLAEAAQLEVIRRGGLLDRSERPVADEYDAALAASGFMDQLFEHFGKREH